MEVWNKQVRMQPVDITLRCLVVWIVDFVHILAIHIVLSSNLDKLLAAVNYPFSSQYFLLIPPDKIHQETKGFLMFSRGIESEHLEGKGYVGILDETFVDKYMWCFARLCYHWYNLENVKNIHGRVLLLLK